MTLQPQNVAELQQIIRDHPLVRLRGGATKSRSDATVDLRGITGMIEYSPEECVFTAHAGTSLAEISDALRTHGQYLPFDPPFVDEGATIGGTIASGVSGPRRYRYGGVRDFLIGVRVIDGDGRLIRSGGKVVKNAAGFLLHHAMVGSCGRFGALTEVTLKVFPAPEARRTVVVERASVEAAFETAREIERLRYDCEAIDFDAQGTVSVTIAGRAAAIEERAARLRQALGPGSVPGEGDRPRTRGLSTRPGTDPGDIVKVAGLMNCWQKLRQHVTGAHFMCGGAVAWLDTADLPGLGRALDESRLVGHVIRGPSAGARVGHVVHNEFEERVRRVLDPSNRFSAAPHSDR